MESVWWADGDGVAVAEPVGCSQWINGMRSLSISLPSSKPPATAALLADQSLMRPLSNVECQTLEDV